MRYSFIFVHFVTFGIQFLQGIGEKMAEYIIDLREESPLKSVSIKNIYTTDTELSQHNAFSDALVLAFCS